MAHHTLADLHEHERAGSRGARAGCRTASSLLCDPPSRLPALVVSARQGMSRAINTPTHALAIS